MSPSASSDLDDLLRSLLDVLDNLERALTSVSEAPGSEPSALSEGVRGIHRQLLDTLYRYDVRKFESVGAPFDPSRHEAFGQLDSPDVPANHCAVEVRRGYLRGESLFRPARVLVSTGRSTGRSTGAQAAVTGAVKRERRPDRSALNRPGWLVNPPPSTPTTLHLIGRSRGARDLEEGESAARDAVVCALLETIAELRANDPLSPCYANIARALQVSSAEGLWSRVVSAFPSAQSWLDDHFWERLTSEIHGTVYDVAVLATVATDSLSGMLVAGDLERWGGLDLHEVGPLLAAALGGVEGAILTNAAAAVAGRLRLEVGDVIVKVGNRDVPDAASARRLLTLFSRRKRPFDLTFLRGLGKPETSRVEPLSPHHPL